MIKTTKERADIQVTWIDIVEFNERQIFKAFPVTRSKAVPSSHIMQNNFKKSCRETGLFALWCS